MQRYRLSHGKLREHDDGEWMKAEEVLALANRPLDDDANMLLNRCEAKEPLSLAEQHELYLWFEERGETIADYDETIERLSEVCPVCEGKHPYCSEPSCRGTGRVPRGYSELARRQVNGHSDRATQ
jgi:hypothetical protein